MLVRTAREDWLRVVVSQRIGRERALPLFTGAALVPLGLGGDARAEPA